jgi:PhzF family phenazine biosynthesis protein
MAAMEEQLIRLFQVDAFASTPFHGNPAAVCIPDVQKDEPWMMHVAAEMNLSETAFLSPQTDGYGLRWFTPTKEVSLCGHATLASAHILWEEGLVSDQQEIHFRTLSGLLIAKSKGKLIQLDFPARMVEPTKSNLSINEALGAVPVSTNRYAVPNGTIYLLEYQSETIVRELKPDFKRLSETDGRAIIVTGKSDSDGQDFVSRYFAPAVGIDEDPVTGSAHCYLAPYWSARLGKTDLIGFQASQRNGYVRCRHDRDRVYLEGSAVTIFKGTLLA